VEPDIVPDKLSSPVNYKVLVIIGALVIGFHIFVNTFEESDMFVYGFSMIIPATVSIFAFITAKRYTGARVYSKAYTMLGVAFLLMFCAEFTYYVYEQILEIEPYPSIADVFFFGFYPMLIIYLIINIRFFEPKITTIGWISIITVPIMITSGYVALTISDFGSFDFFYGIIFVSAASATLGLSINTAKIFRGGLIGTAWLVLVIGIMINAIGDTWYYYNEINHAYTLEDPVNLCWYSAYLLILYSLYKHKKSL